MALFDFFGTFSRSRRASPTRTYGSSGTAIYGGFIVDNEKEPTLKGTRRYQTFSEILANTTIVGAGVRYFLNLSAKVDWKVEPADNSDAAKQVAEFVEQLMYEDMDTPWFRVVRRACMHRFYGFSLQEWTAKRREDGMLTMKDIQPRAQLTIRQWDVDEEGRVDGVVQVSPQTAQAIYIPRQKLLYTVDDTLNDSPEGLGLFRHIVSAAKRLERYEQLEGFGYESDLRGVPVGRAPLAELQALENQQTMKKEEVRNRLSVLTEFIKKHIKNPQLGLILDSKTYYSKGDSPTPSSVYEYDIDLLQGDNPNLNQVASAIDRVNREIGRVLGVEHLLLGDGDRGSEALARSKADNFALIVNSTLNEVRESVDKDIVATALRLNGIDMALKPQLSTDAVSFRSVQDITQSLRDMATAGAPLAPDDEAINEVRDLLGLSRVSFEDMEEDAMIGGGTTDDQAEEELNEEDDDNADA